MNQIKLCPECHFSLQDETGSCVCGWKAAKKNIQSVSDTLCQFRESGERCDEPGVMTHSRNSQVWYCPDHYHQIRRTNFVSAEPHRAQRRREARIDWRWSGRQTKESNQSK